MVVLSPGDAIVPIKRLKIKYNKKAGRKARVARFSKLIKMMQAPDNRAASFTGSAK